MTDFLKIDIKLTLGSLRRYTHKEIGLLVVRTYINDYKQFLRVASTAEWCEYGLL